MRIMNSTTSEYTKVRPCDIIYGGAINPDRGIFISMDERPKMRTPLEHIEKIAIVQERLIKFTRENLKRHDATHLNAAHTKSPPTLYAEGSYVLLQYPGHTPSRTKPPMAGPFKVLKNEGNSHYLLQDLVDKKERRVHVSRMKVYLFDTTFTNPREVAARDQDEVLVEAILNHRGNFIRKSELIFLVRWVGYTAEFDQWIPSTNNLRRNDKLHTTLQDIGKGSMIPKEFR